MKKQQTGKTQSAVFIESYQSNHLGSEAILRSSPIYIIWIIFFWLYMNSSALTQF